MFYVMWEEIEKQAAYFFLDSEGSAEARGFFHLFMYLSFSKHFFWSELCSNYYILTSCQGLVTNNARLVQINSQKPIS